jgi:RNA polymerase sigma factor (sigma-70 family)
MVRVRAVGCTPRSHRWQNESVDKHVLERFRLGDEQAVKAVYDMYSGAVYSVAMSILRDPGRAADATQQTFVKAWRSAETFDVDRKFAPWIYSIARRTAIDIYRKERRRIPSEFVDTAVDGASMERVWEVFEVRVAVDRLADEEREVVRMSHFESLTHAEIAKRLDIPLGTVKSRSHRAHQHLIELLDHVGEGE